MNFEGIVPGFSNILVIVLGNYFVFDGCVNGAAGIIIDTSVNNTDNNLIIPFLGALGFLSVDIRSA